MNIADDLVKAFNEGYAQGKAETEAYLLHCGDVTPVTNADMIRAMTDEELASFLYHTWNNASWCNGVCDGECSCEPCWLNWLKQEVDE